MVQPASRRFVAWFSQNQRRHNNHVLLTLATGYRHQSTRNAGLRDRSPSHLAVLPSRARASKQKRDRRKGPKSALLWPADQNLADDSCVLSR